MRDWTDTLKNIALILLIVVTASIVGMSVWANFAENDSGIAKPPAIEKARYEFLVRNTGQLIYADSYEHPRSGLYILKNFYVEKRGSYKLQKTELMLDERIFGKIKITDRKASRSLTATPQLVSVFIEHYAGGYKSHNRR